MSNKLPCKPSMDLLSAIALRGLGNALGHGACKHGSNDWRTSDRKWSEHIGAAYRHLTAFLAGEDIDNDSGLPNIDLLACRVHFLQELFVTRKNLDDRYKAKKGHKK